MLSTASSALLFEPKDSRVMKQQQQQQQQQQDSPPRLLAIRHDRLEGDTDMLEAETSSPVEGE